MRSLGARSFVLLYFSTVSFVALPCSVWAEEPIRMWIDTTGKYRVDARLIAHEGENVRLAREDGAIIELPLAKLCEEDRLYVEKYDGANPFLAGMKSAPTRTPSTKSAPSAEKLSPGPIDWSSVPRIDVPLVATPLELPLSTANPPKELARRTIALPPKSDFFERPRSLVADPATGTAIFSSVVGRPGKPPTTRLVRVDLAGGGASGAIEIDGELAALAWDAASERVLVARSARQGEPEDSAIQVWSLAGGAAHPVFVHAESSDNRGSRRAAWGAFLADDRFASLSNGRFAVWSLTTGKPLATLEVDSDAVLGAIRPDGAVIALVSGRGVTFLDATKLTCVGRMDESLGSPKDVAFSPDGARLAIKLQRTALVWNLADGERVAELKSTSPFDGPFFLADEARLFDRGRLIDVATDTPILEIVDSSDAGVACGGSVWLVAHGARDARSLVALQPVPRDIDDRIAAFQAGPIEWSLPEKSSIRLDLSSIPAGAPRDDTEKAIVERLTAAGHTLDEDAELVLIATVRIEPAMDYEYTRVERNSPVPGFVPRPIGSFGDRIVERRQFKIAPAVASLELKLGEETIWKGTHSQLPQGMIGLSRIEFGANVDLKEGQTIEQFVEEIEKVDYARFARIDLPRSVRKPGAWQEPVLGKRRLTPAGLE